MKLLQNICLALLCVILVSSCEQDSESIIDDTANLTLQDALTQIIEQTESSENPIDFGIKMFQDGSVALGKNKPVDTSFESDSVRGFKIETNLSFSDLIQQSDLEICCTINGETDCTSCPNNDACLLYTSPSPRDQRGSRMPSSA